MLRHIVVFLNISTIYCVCGKLFVILMEFLRGLKKLVFVQLVTLVTGYNSPLCRAEHWRFYREQPVGVRQGCRTLLEGQESLPANPYKNARAQEASGIGSLFLWILSFGEAKESISPASARTGF
jgi:hypothetical protein